MIFKLPLSIKALLIPCITVVFLYQTTMAQEVKQATDSGQHSYPAVKWVKTWPSAESKRKDKSFGKVVKAIVFGKKTPPLNRPVATIASNPDVFWVADQGNNTIYQVQNEVGEIHNFIERSKFEFSSLVGLCALPNNKMLITDSYLKKIFCLDPVKKELLLLNDKLVLEQPTGIAWSAVTNEIWVVETSAHRITILNEKGEIIKRIGKRGIKPGEFNFPTHIWIDAKGNVYIIDSMNFRVQVFDKNGEIVTVFGSQGDATGFFARPKGIATDSFGNIYIVDGLFHAVQVFDLKGNFLYKFGGQGHGDGEFWMPTGLFIDDHNFIYVADSYNARIQIFQLIQDSQ